MAKTAAAVSAMALGGVAAGIGAATTAAMGFEKTMSGIAAVSGLDQMGAEFKELSQLALKLGADTSFSASEAAAGMQEMVKAGVTIEEIMQGAARATLDLAAAGAVDVAEAAQIASNAMNIFNKSGADMAHIADLLAGAANASAISVHEIGYSLSSVGAVAATVGLTIEDTTTAIAVLGDAGLRSSDAGTSLKTMLLNLQPTTEKATEAFRDLGIITKDGANQFFTAEGSAKSMSEIAEVLQSSMEGLTKAQQLQKLETMFGTDAIRAAAIMAEAGAEGFNEMADAVGKVSAQAVADERLNNLSGSIQKLTGSLEVAAITLGMKFTPGLKVLVDRATEAVNAARPFIDTYGDQLAGAIGAAAESLTELSKQFMGWIDQVRGADNENVLALFDRLKNVLTVELPAALDDLRKKFAGLEAFIVEHWQAAIVGAVGVVALAMVAAARASIAAWLPVALPIIAVGVAIAALYEAWQRNVGGMQEQTQKFYEESVVPAFGGLVGWLEERIPSAIEWLTNTGWPLLLSSGIAFVGWVQETAIPTLRGFAGWVGEKLGGAISFATSVWPVLLSRGIAFIGWVQDTAIPALQGLAGWIGEKLGGAIGVAVAAWPVLLDLGQRFAALLKGTIIPELEWFGKVIGYVFERLLKGDLAGGLGVLADVLMQMLSDFRTVATSALQAQVARIDWRAVWSRAVGAASALVDWIFEAGKDMAGKLGAWLGGQAASIDWVAVWGRVRNVISTLADQIISTGTALGSRLTAWLAATAASIDWASVWGRAREIVSTLADQIIGTGTELGKRLGAWLGEQWEIAWAEVKSGSMGKIAQQIEDIVVTIQQAFAGDWSSDAIIDPLTNAIGQIAVAFKTLGDKAREVFEQIPGYLDTVRGRFTDMVAEMEQLGVFQDLRDIWTELSKIFQVFIDDVTRGNPQIATLGENMGGAAEPTKSFAANVKELTGGILELIGYANATADFLNMIHRGSIDAGLAIRTNLLGALNETAAGMEAWFVQQGDAWNTWNAERTAAWDAWHAERTAAWNGFWHGIWQIIADTWQSITDTITENAGTVWAAVEQAWKDIHGTANDLWHEIWQVIADTWKSIFETSRDTLGNIKDQIAGSAGDMGNAAGDLGKSIYDGILGWVGKIIGAVKSVIDTVRGLLPGGGGAAAPPTSGTRDTSAMTPGDYVRYAAELRGLDPDQVASVMLEEGGGTEWNRVGTFPTGTSYGPLQLHYAGGTDPKRGMGDAFTAATGIDLRKVGDDPAAQKAAIDYALDRLSEAGDYHEWYGADKALGSRYTPVTRIPPRTATTTAAQNNQFVASEAGLLTWDEAAAACGPAAVVWFMERTGRLPDGQEAQAIANVTKTAQAASLWSPEAGTYGPGAFQSMATAQGVSTDLDLTPTAEEAMSLARSGTPFVISTDGHYYQVSGVNQAGEFNVGGSGTALRAGSEFMSLDAIKALSGPMNGIITLTGQLGDTTVASADQMSTAITALPGVVAPPLADTVTAITPLNDSLVEIGDSGETMASVIGETTGSMQEQATESFGTMASDTVASASDMSTGVVDNVTALTEGSTDLMSSMGSTVAETTGVMAEDVVTGAEGMNTGVVDSVTAMADGSIELVDGMGSTVAESAGVMAEDVVVGAADMNTGVVDAVTEMTGSSTELIGSMGDTVTETADTMGTETAGSVETMGSDVAGSIDGMERTVVSTVDTMGSTVTGAAGEMGSDVVDSVDTMGSDVGSSVETMGSDVIDVAGTMGDQVTTAAGTMESDTSEAAMTMRDQVAAAAAQMEEEARAEAEAMASGVYDALHGMADDAAGSTSTMSQDVQNILSSLATRSAAMGDDIGSNMGDGIASGIDDSVPAVQEAATDIIEAAEDAAEEAAEIYSPSKVFARLGRQLTLGLAEGVRSGIPIANEAVRELMAVPNGRNGPEYVVPVTQSWSEVGTPAADGINSRRSSGGGQRSSWSETDLSRLGQTIAAAIGQPVTINGYSSDDILRKMERQRRRERLLYPQGGWSA